MRYTVNVAGRSIEVELVYQEGNIWASVGAKRVPVELHQHSTSGFHTLMYGHRRVRLWLTGQGTGYVIHWHGQAYPVDLALSSVQRLRQHLRPHSMAKAVEEIVAAYMPGLIVKVEVEEGQRVRKGDGLLVMEAMKMENEIRAPCDGTIEKIAVDAGREVSRGQLLCVIRPDHAEVSS